MVPCKHVIFHSIFAVIFLIELPRYHEPQYTYQYCGQFDAIFRYVYVLDLDVRLGGSTDESSPRGKVEVYENVKWTSICVDGFGSMGADTVCRMLGFHTG